MTSSIFQWPASRKTTRRSVTRHIVVHCAATREGQRFTATDIDAWHRRLGWAGIGYHYVVLLDGSIEEGRPLDAVGSHVAGQNSSSIGICYIGGVDAQGRPKDTRTPEQKAALLQLLRHLKATYRAQNPVIQGHRDFPGVAKACPSFDAKSEYAKL
jgi:N-acetylmuramoyl-L-alanine amidase